MIAINDFCWKYNSACLLNATELEIFKKVKYRQETHKDLQETSDFTLLSLSRQPLSPFLAFFSPPSSQLICRTSSSAFPSLFQGPLPGKMLTELSGGPTINGFDGCNQDLELNSEMDRQPTLLSQNG